jgi:hypothetical protein
LQPVAHLMCRLQAVPQVFVVEMVAASEEMLLFRQALPFMLTSRREQAGRLW